jgi:hypothetical protein
MRNSVAIDIKRRRLRGAAIRNFTPATALEGNTPSFWLDAAPAYLNGGGGIADGAAVSAWVSRDAGARNFVQVTGTKQPLYRASAINGKPGVDFDGTDDIMTVASGFLSGTVGTCILVYVFDTVGANQTLFSQANGTTVADWMAFRAGDGQGRSTYDFRNGGADTLQSFSAQSPTTVAGQTRVAVWQTDGSNLTERVNGTVYIVPANRGDWWGDLTALVPNQVSIGGRWRTGEDQFFNGKLCEIICYPINLSLTSINTIGYYLHQKYGVPA